GVSRAPARTGLERRSSSRGRLDAVRRDADARRAMDPRHADLGRFAGDLADLARGIARRWFRRLDAVDTKADRTPVTPADREIEHALRARIRAAFPEHGVLGEEEGSERVDAEYVWVLDPIDGTKAFASGNPLFGTLIGLMHRGEPVVGVLEAPGLGERWSAVRGGGAFHDGRRIAAGAGTALADAVLYTTTPDPLAAHEGFAALRRGVRWTCYGGDCCGYAFVAMGGADLIVDAGLKPY